MTVSYNPLLTPSVCFSFSTPKGCFHRCICSFVLDLLLGYSAVLPFFLNRSIDFWDFSILSESNKKNNVVVKERENKRRQKNKQENKDA